MRLHKPSGLYVTKNGLVFKEARISSYGHKKGYLYCIRQFIGSNGYPTVTEYVPATQESRNWPVHQLVAEVYLEPVEGKPYIDHIDRNKLNSDISNLRYVSQTENNLNREVSDKALAKWGFHPCEDRKAYKAAWARNKRRVEREQHACGIISIATSEKAA